MFQNNIYALGGFTSSPSLGYTSSVEQFDMRANKWTEFTDLPIKTGYFGCAVTKSKKVSVRYLHVTLRFYNLTQN